MYKGYKIGVAVPAYNEEKLIGETLKGIPSFVDRIYVVDDCSEDRTAEIAEQFSKRDLRISLIRHEKNMGKGAATISGWKAGIKVVWIYLLQWMQTGRWIQKICQLYLIQ